MATDDETLTDQAAADKPPDPPKERRKPGPKPGSKPKGGRRGPKVSDQQIRESVQATLAMVGSAVMAFDAFDGQIIIVRSEDVANGLLEASKQSPQLRKALVTATQTTVWAQVAMLGASIAMPILAHHGRLPLEVGRMFCPDEMRPMMEAQPDRPTKPEDGSGDDSSEPSLRPV